METQRDMLTQHCDQGPLTLHSKYLKGHILYYRFSHKNTPPRPRPTLTELELGKPEVRLFLVVVASVCVVVVGFAVTSALSESHYTF